MIGLSFFCGFLVIATAQGDLDQDGRIVNGSNTVITEHPYQVSIEHYGIHRCGGSIIGTRFIATAAHCTENVNLNRFTIRAGTTFKEIDGQVVKVKAIHNHPKHNKLTNDYDLSLLELEEDININDSAQIIELWEEGFEPPIGFYGTITGWGRLNETTPGPIQLQVLHVLMLDIKICKKAYGSGVITPRMVCAGYIEGGSDSCQGDSGGPLWYYGKLYGIISFGRGCARPGYPGVYASIPALRSFIKDISGI